MTSEQKYQLQQMINNDSSLDEIIKTLTKWKEAEQEKECWVITYCIYDGSSHAYVFDTKEKALDFIKRDTAIMRENLTNDGEYFRQMEHENGSVEIYVPAEDFYYKWCLSPMNIKQETEAKVNE